MIDIEFSGPGAAFELYDDGSCLGNPGPGGWACIVRDRYTGEEQEHAGGERSSTNNRMELTAVIEGLRRLPPGSEVHLCSDSKYVIQGIRDWMAGWKRRSWRTANKKPVLNVELWKEIDRLVADHDVHVEWTRGHAGHTENERCDALAHEQAEKQRSLASSR